MIPGALGREETAFNDEALWTGGPYNPNNPEGPVKEYAIRLGIRGAPPPIRSYP
jgi:hypothetical protein